MPNFWRILLPGETCSQIPDPIYIFIDKFSQFPHRTEIGRTALRYRGPISWNALPTETKECENRTTFKIKLKRDKTINKVSYI